jgi:hypothetical protein
MSGIMLGWYKSRLCFVILHVHLYIYLLIYEQFIYKCRMQLRLHIVDWWDDEWTTNCTGVQESGRGLCKNTIAVFLWINWGNHENLSR